MTENQPKFSKKSIDKAVMGESMQSPLTLYPAVIGALGFLGVAAFGLSTMTIAVGAGGLGLAAGGWLFEYFGRYQKYSLSYLKKIHEELQAQRLNKMVQLQTELATVNAQEAQLQLQLFSNKFDNFRSILDKKFEASELTYARYLGIAEQVFLAGLDNLENYYLTLKSVSAVNLPKLTARLDELNKAHDISSQQIEIDALSKRLALYHEQKQKVQKIKQQNEIALTELDLVTTKLANVQTKKGLADLDMDNAMEELARMTKRTEEYRI